MSARGTRIALVWFVSIVFMALFIFPLRAESENQAKAIELITKEKTEDEFQHEMDLWVRYAPGSSLKAQPGEIAIVQSESEYRYNFKAFGKLPIEFCVNSEYVNIIEKKNDLPIYLPPKLTGVGFGTQVTLPFFRLDKTYFRIMVVPSFFSDHWDFEAKAFRIPIQAFAIYQPEEKLTFIGGVALYPHFENKVFPILGLIYQPNDKLIFDLVPSRPNITYTLNDYLSVFLEGGASWNEYRVSQAGERFATLTYNENHIGTGIKFSPHKHLNAYISSGYMFGRQLQYRDSLGKASLKNDLYSEFRIEMQI